MNEKYGGREQEGKKRGGSKSKQKITPKNAKRTLESQVM
jgi:hypothetical protein